MQGGGDCKTLRMQLLVHFRREKSEKGKQPSYAQNASYSVSNDSSHLEQSSEHFVMSVSNHITLGWVQRGLAGG